MHAVIRSYTGDSAGRLADLLGQRKADLQQTMGGIRGFVSYEVIRTDEGLATVTVCQDEAGVGESVRVAQEWIAGNARDLNTAPPKISSGPVIVHVG